MHEDMMTLSADKIYNALFGHLAFELKKAWPTGGGGYKLLIGGSLDTFPRDFLFCLLFLFLDII